MSRTKSTEPAFPSGEVLKLTCTKGENKLYITFDGVKYSSWALIDGKYVRQKTAKNPVGLEEKFWNS